MKKYEEIIRNYSGNYTIIKLCDYKLQPKKRLDFKLSSIQIEWLKWVQFPPIY